VGTESFLRKYPIGTPFTDRAPVIRYAEVLLNLAEAKACTTNAANPQALALLNAVRGRSDSSAVNTAVSLATPAALVDAILLERRIEFLGEGLRINYTQRLNATIPDKGAVEAIAPSNIHYVWPIPSTELATNALMTRNE